MAEAKNGAEHLASLRDGRAVFIDGRRVADVTTDPAFRNAVHSAAALYDFQARPENLERMTFVPPGGGRRVNRCWQMARDHAELVARREALALWAEQSGGFVGRSPDHVASALLGQVIGIEVFRRHGEARAKALLDYFDYARRNDLFLTYVIINPQADRSKAWGAQEEELVARLVDEDAAGITVRGAKMLGTSAIMANEVLVANLQPLQPGEEDLALSFAIPMATQGSEDPVAQILRGGRGLASSTTRSPRASTRTTRSSTSTTSRCRGSGSSSIATPTCAAPSSTTRSATPSRTTRRRSASRSSSGFWPASPAASPRRSAPRRSRRCARNSAGSRRRRRWSRAWCGGWKRPAHAENGCFVPDKHLMYAAQVLTQELYPRIIDKIRSLAGGALIMLPSSARDFDDPDLAHIIEHSQRSPAASPRDRVQFPQARLGRDRLRIRLAPHPVRDVLCRRPLRHLRPQLPHLRLGGFRGFGRSDARWRLMSASEQCPPGPPSTSHQPEATR